MLLAAGRGERMGRLTSDQPKPLLRVGNQSLIERNLTQLAAAGIADVVVNLSYGARQIRTLLGDGERFALRIVYSEEPEPPLEAAGGIVNALSLLGSGPFLLVNSDVVSDVDLAELIAVGRPELVLVPNPPHHPLGDFGLAADGRLSSAEPKLTYAGIAVLDSSMFDGLEPGRRPLKPTLDAAIERGTLFGRLHAGFWLDVGTPERLQQARVLASGVSGRQ
jgi:MurNAc alpha-1-phosphate uridylyltransferase